MNLDRINNVQIKVWKDDNKAKGKYLFEDKPETIKVLINIKNDKFNNLNFYRSINMRNQTRLKYPIYEFINIMLGGKL